MNTAETVKLLEEGTGYDEPRAMQPVTPMTLLESAVVRGADIGTIERLLDLRLKYEAAEAKKAFVEAMNAFKAEAPTIVKDRTVSFNQTSYRYATLANVCNQVTAALSKHGISHRWRTEQSDGLIRVTCILTHELGHSEETTLMAGPDQTGSKNSIQALGSAMKYLMRYTVLAATGLEAGDEDNDGRGAGGAVMETLEMHLARISESNDLAMLERAFKDAYKEATGLMAIDAMRKLAAKKDEIKAKLQKAAQ